MKAKPRGPLATVLNDVNGLVLGAKERDWVISSDCSVLLNVPVPWVWQSQSSAVVII